jgi:hypothetical protein
MKEHDLADDELKALSPLLRDQKRKGDGLQLPPGYFDRMEAEILNKTVGKAAGRNTARSVAPPLQARTRNLWVRRTATAAAAALALLLTAWWFFKPQTAPVQAEALAVSTQTPSDEEIEVYVLENLQDFETEQLAILQPASGFGAVPPLQDETTAPKPDEASKSELKPEDLERLLDDMSDEELEEIL